MAKRHENPDEIIHVQARPGQVIRLGEHAYGDRGTVQVRRGDLDRLEGDYEQVNPVALPDAGARA